LGVIANFPCKNIRAKGDAVIADVDPWARDEFFYLRMALATEGAKGEVIGAGHGGTRTTFSAALLYGS
jgi:hypothetical protein